MPPNLPSLFPPAQSAATQQVVVWVQEKDSAPLTRRQPAAKVLELVSRRIEPEENVCSYCGKTQCGAAVRPD